MTNATKIVQYSDTIINCIPLVSTVNSLSQALYKLAHKVDVLNPVTPGYRTSVKIHVLSKSNLELFFNAIPIIGNFISFSKLILSSQFQKHDDLENAIITNNQEVIRLYLGNGEINAIQLKNSFQKCSFGVPFENALIVKNFWASHLKQLKEKDLEFTLSAMECLLRQGHITLAEDLFVFFPIAIPLEKIKSLFLEFSYPQPFLKNATLTAIHRKALMERTRKPVLKDVIDYYQSIDKGKIQNGEYLNAQLEVLYTVIDFAELKNHELYDFFSHLIDQNDRLFADLLMKKYESKLTISFKKRLFIKLVAEI